MVKVDIDLGGAYEKLNSQSVNRGRYAMANQAMSDMNQFVPAKSHVLRLSAFIGTDGSSIHYNTPYASRMFYVPMQNYTTPGTGSRWDLKATRMFVSDWANAFMKGAGW